MVGVRHLLWRGLICLLPGAAGVADGTAAVHEFSLGDAGNRTLRLNVPDNLPVVRGILIFGNGGGADLRAMATDPEFVAFAESMGFAALGTSLWSWFDPGYTPSELSGFEYALQRLAAISGHPELVRAPWLPVGHSNGGSISWGLNAQRPEKVIAVAINKAGASIPRPAGLALRTPAILVAGDSDQLRLRDAVRDLFAGNRPRGLLGAWVEEESSNHAVADSFELIYPFAAEIHRLRYPPGGSPQFAPVTLLPVNEADGWLTDPQSFARGFAEIAPYAEYTKDRSVAGWLPNRRLAYIFRAFASYDLSRCEASLSPGAGPIDWGSRVTYTIGAPIAAWRTIEFYEGDTLLKRIAPAEGELLEWTARVVTPGYNVFHAVVTRADGTQRTTMPRRVFVRPPASGAIAGATTVPTGGSTVLTAAAPGGTTTHRWQIDAGGGWQELSDGAIPGAGNARCLGTGTASLTLAEVPAALNGGRFRCVFSGGFGTQQSASATLAVAPPPALTAVSAAPEAAVATGTRVTLAVQAGAGDLAYRWYRDGVALPWLAGPSVSFIAGAGDVGAYAVVATDAFDLSTRVELGSLSVAADARLVNLSARARVQSGDGLLIAGFVTAGASPAAGKPVLVRGIGPELSRAHGVAGALGAVQLGLFDATGGSVAAATGWEENLAPTFARLGAFPLPAGSRDAALLRTVPPGAFTVHVSAADGVPGVGLVEVYDADADETSVRLVNVSARAPIGTGEDMLIGGFVVTGKTSATVLVRAVGPGLRAVLSGAMAKTALAVFDVRGNVVATNTGWLQAVGRGSSTLAAGGEPASARIMAQAGAALLSPPRAGYLASWDSALLLTLPPGVYTAQVSGAEGESGLGLVEVYEVR